jgi:diacylglycerol kinase family enzyme
VHHFQIQSCHIHADDEVPAHLDGENQPLQRDFEISVLPGELRIL